MTLMECQFGQTGLSLVKAYIYSPIQEEETIFTEHPVALESRLYTLPNHLCSPVCGQISETTAQSRTLAFYASSIYSYHKQQYTIHTGGRRQKFFKGVTTSDSHLL